MTDTESARVAPGYLGDGVSPSHNDKNLHHILTDAEREAIERAAFVSDQAGLEKSAATLRNLLERMK